MKNYILHIGLPKTATTTLQRYYFPNVQEPSLCYNPPSLIAPLVEALKLLDFGTLKSDDIKLLYDIIQWESKKIPKKNILISLEILSQRLLKFDFAGRVQFLKSIFPNATIILVLRYQPALLRSLYQQHVSQNYFLRPEDVFIPFTKHAFQEAENWKANMQINIKEWDYKETIKHFRHYYGKQFHVLFFENYFNSIHNLGRKILEDAGFYVNNELAYTTLPATNVTYDSITTNIILGIAYRKLAFHSNYGFNCRHIQDILEQSNQARFLFDASNIDEYTSRLKNRQYVYRSTYSLFDKRLLKLIKMFSKAYNYLNSHKYELPEPIRFYLEHESKILNSSLPDVVDRESIPNLYL